MRVMVLIDVSSYNPNADHCIDYVKRLREQHDEVGVVLFDTKVRSLDEDDLRHLVSRGGCLPFCVKPVLDKFKPDDVVLIGDALSRVY